MTVRQYRFFEHRQKSTSHLVMKHPDGWRLHDIQIKPDELLGLLKK